MSSRTGAHTAIEAGQVTVGGAPAVKASRLVAPDEAVELLRPARRYVSRGGDKLAAALDQFAVVVDGRLVLDAGSSTGGFTDCVLQRGASSVVAVDVGHHQLHESLRADPRVTVREGLNIREATVDAIGGPFEVIVADLSFISLKTVSAALFALAAPAADLVWLVKPQFEAGRREVSRGRGVVRDESVRRQVRDDIDAHLRERGADVRGWMDCPLAGPAGNVEWLVHAVGPGHPQAPTASGAHGTATGPASDTGPVSDDGGVR